MLRLIFFIMITIGQQALGAEDAFMSLVPSYTPPEGSELIIKETLDVSERALKAKSFIKTKFYGMKHIKYVSIFHDSKDPLKKYQVSFFFHGEENEFAVKISSVDLRRYFQQKIAIDESRDQCPKVIQSHFEEYNRKSRVFYTADEKLNFESADKFLEMATKAHQNAFLKKNPTDVFVITNNCRGVGNFEYEWPGLMKGHFFIPPKFLDEILGEYETVKLKNSNGEIPLNHSNSFTELRTTKFYAEQIELNNWFGIKNKFVQWFSAFKDPNYQWYDLGDFDKAAKNCPLEKVTEALLKNSPAQKLEKFVVHTEKGKIPYEQFPAETRMKSGAVYMQESLAYTKTPCSNNEKISLPPNFLVPEGEGIISQEDYWKKNKCALIPHFFANYEDILNYPVYLSKFEIDGVYVGRSKNEDDPVISAFDKSLQYDETKRVPYNFSQFIGNYKEAIVVTSDDLLSVRLINSERNIIIGNLSLAKLIDEEKKPIYVSSFNDLDLFESNVIGVSALFGINTGPLVNNYNSSFDPNLINSKPIPFALFYNDEGRILNHHLPSIGVEQWFARKRGCLLVIDLISHERILPLARLSIEYFCKNNSL
jgi:hypothetical protein